MEERKHIVILAAGDFPSHPVPLRALREADFVVCCDSAYERLRDYETTRQQDLDVSTSRRLVDSSSYIVIGDGDSLSEADKTALGDRWIEESEQDYNDLHKAMDWAIVEGGRRKAEGGAPFDLQPPTSDLKVTILGATGRREDHTLGNISYLVTFAEEHPGADIEMLTNHGRFCAMRGSRAFESFPGQQISIFSLEPDRPINGSGLRWPLDGFHARRWWQATLNEALGNRFLLASDGWLVVFRTYEPKRGTVKS